MPARCVHYYGLKINKALKTGIYNLLKTTRGNVGQTVVEILEKINVLDEEFEGNLNFFYLFIIILCVTVESVLNGIDITLIHYHFMCNSLEWNRHYTYSISFYV